MAYEYINDGNIDSTAVSKGVKGNKKARLLQLLKVLNEETDQEHQLSTNEIIEKMREQGLSVNRKTVKDDVDLLISSGYDVIVTKSANNSFYMGERIFEFSDLKMLVDAVSAAKIISTKSTNILINRIKQLCSKYQAEELVWNKNINANIKPYSKYVNITVDKLAKAINKRRRIEFKYNVYDLKKELYHKHDGKVYNISPYFTIWNEDHYYLVGYEEAAGKTKTFRIDRIDGSSLVVTNSPARKPETDLFEKYSRSSFSMMADEEKQRTVELKCANSIITNMVDRFGKDVDIKRLDDKHFKMKVNIYATVSFYSWLVQFGEAIEVMGPPTVVEGFKEHLQAIMEKYK